MLYDGNIEAAVIRGRKMRSEALWTLVAGFGRLITRAFKAVQNYRRNAAALRELRGMDRRMLADIGLSYDDVEYAVRHGGFVKSSAMDIDVSAKAPVTDVANDAGEPTERAAA